MGILFISRNLKNEEEKEGEFLENETLFFLRRRFKMEKGNIYICFGEEELHFTVWPTGD